MGETRQGPFLWAHLTGDPRLRGKPVGSAPFAGSGKAKPKPKAKGARKRVAVKTMQTSPFKKPIQSSKIGKPTKPAVASKKKKFNPIAGRDK